MQISLNAEKEIQRFMDDSLDRLCNELCIKLKTEFKEYNKRRKLNGLHELKRMNLEFVQDVLNEKIKTR
jgi:hypothetical protein